MPVIQFTESDRLAGKLAEKGGYTAQLTKLGAPTASSSQKSVSFQADFVVTKGPLMNKKFEIFFNTETSGNGLLGTRQYAPHNWILSRLAPAILNIPASEVPLTLDTDILMNKDLDILVDVVTAEGNVGNIITGFFPEGKAQGKNPF